MTTAALVTHRGNAVAVALPRGPVAAPYDTALRWWVTSETDPLHPHLVDLAGLNGNGVCTCKHFQFRLAPEIRAMGRSPSDATRCRHIMTARAALVDEAIARLSKINNGPRRT